MPKIDSKEILESAKKKDRPERANYTFRFNKAVIDDFKKVCEEQSVTQTAVLEEFMARFAADIGKKSKRS